MFSELKATRRTYWFIVFKIQEKQKQVVVEKFGELAAQSYKDFKEGKNSHFMLGDKKVNRSLFC